MKKFLIFCFVAVAATFVSCSKDDDTVNVSKSNLVGRWEIYKTVEIGDGETYVDEEFGEEYGWHEIYEFRDDNTGVKIDMDYYGGNWHTEEHSFTYSINGNKISMSEGGSTLEVTVEKLTSTEVVFMAKEGEYVYRAYMKRI